MALKVGELDIPIFARFNGQDIPIGTVTVPVKVNASSVIREAQDAFNDQPERGAVDADSITVSPKADRSA